MQYEVGKEFTESGKIECCNRGLHSCEYPLNVLGYYPPINDNRYCTTEASGVIDKGNDDTKVASSKLTVKAEIGLNGLIEAGVNFVFEKVKWEDAKESNTGHKSAATNTGNQSAATNTGDLSAATNTGYQSAATNTGNKSAATVEGKESIAIVTGKDSKAKGALDCWLVLTERGDWDGSCQPIIEVRAVKVDGITIKENVFYELKDGILKEA